MKNKKRLFILTFDVVVFFVIIWHAKSWTADIPLPENRSTVLGDLSYAEHPHSDFTIYIEEMGGYQPYYVLTNTYGNQDGVALLLRKYTLDNLMQYQPYTGEGTNSAYYDNSSIDQYLSSEFLEQLSPNIKENLQDSTITIVDNSMRTSLAGNMHEIVRKVFLPSLEDVGFDANYMWEDAEIRADNLFYPVIQTGASVSWWTRDPFTLGNTEIWAVNPQAVSIFNARTGKELGVRPAFCLPDNLTVKWKIEASGYAIEW